VRLRSAFAAALLLTVASARTPDYAKAGSYGWTFRTLDIPGTTQVLRNSRIYFPDSGGAFPRSAMPAPIVVFGHGWQMGIGRYYSYAEHLASWGYVVVMPTYSNPIFSPHHDRRARLVVDAARYVSALDTVPGDRFFGTLDRWNWGFAGHSLGGSVSLLAADRFGLYDTLRAVVAIASPPSVPPTDSRHVLTPRLLLLGEVDRFAPWQEAREAFWMGSHAPATFAVIRGADHGLFMDYSRSWEDGGRTRITRGTQQMLARRCMTAYFERYLHGDTSAWNFAYTHGDSIRNHAEMETVEVRLLPLCITEPFVAAADGPDAAFEPAQDRLPLRYGLPEDDSVLVAVYGVRGNRVRTLLECRKSAGVHATAWDGKDDAGNLMPEGVYVVACSVRGRPTARCEVVRR
jgi:dienelactone hydrolase